MSFSRIYSLDKCFIQNKNGSNSCINLNGTYFLKNKVSILICCVMDTNGMHIPQLSTTYEVEMIKGVKPCQYIYSHAYLS